MAAVSAVYRGYFQGRHNMIPTALSGIVETTVRIFMMLAFSYFMIPYGIEYAAAGAMTGVAVGELSGMLVLYFYYGINNRQQPDRAIAHIGTGQNPRRLSTLKKAAENLNSCNRREIGRVGFVFFLESILIVHSLAAAGVATKLATAQYGSLQGMILPIVLLPSALTYSLAVSLVPFLSEAAAKKDMPSIHNRLHQSLKLSLVTGAPFVVMMYILADPLVEVLYNQQSIGLMLRMLAPIALFIYFQAPLQATLQALDRPVNALVNTFAGSAVKLGLIVWLVSKPEFGIFWRGHRNECEYRRRYHPSLDKRDEAAQFHDGHDKLSQGRGGHARFRLLLLSGHALGMDGPLLRPVPRLSRGLLHRLPVCDSPAEARRSR